MIQPRTASRNIIGWWQPDTFPPEAGEDAVYRGILQVTRPVNVLDVEGQIALGEGGCVALGSEPAASDDLHAVRAYVPALGPEQLGDPDFKQTHRVRYCYIAGAMANGIASERMVEAMGCRAI